MPETPEFGYTVPAYQERPALAVLRFSIHARGGEAVGACGVAAPLSQADVARAEAARLVRIERSSWRDPDAIVAELLEEWGVQPGGGASWLGRARSCMRYAANCHCSECRAATGSAFKPFAGIERSKLAITHGEGNLAIFGEPDGNDTRCGRCGCFLYSVVRDGQYVHVATGSLRDDPTIRPNHPHLRGI